jgi:SAM-dependent methyltransferase
MTRRTRTIEPDYFEARYASDPDPWQFSSSAYERNKYALTLAALPKPRYARAFEIGCSIGVLTRELASRCDAILAVDAAQAPLLQARLRCAEFPDASFERMFVPEQWPDGEFDLILLSEVVYYLDAGDLERLAGRVGGALRSDGNVVLVHWTGETDYPLTGDEAADRFIAAMAETARIERTERHPGFRLDVLGRPQRALSQPRDGAMQT